MSDDLPPPAGAPADPGPPASGADSRGTIALVLGVAAMPFLLPSCCCGLWGACTNTLGMILSVAAAVLASGVKRDIDAGTLDPDAGGPYEAARIIGFVGIGLAVVMYVWEAVGLVLGVGANLLSAMGQM